MTESDIEYLHRRAAEEMRCAEETSDPAAAAIHRRMSALYADQIVALSEHSDPDQIVPTRLTN